MAELPVSTTRELPPTVPDVALLGPAIVSTSVTTATKENVFHDHVVEAFKPFASEVEAISKADLTIGGSGPFTMLGYGREKIVLESPTYPDIAYKVAVVGDGLVRSASKKTDPQLMSAFFKAQSVPHVEHLLAANNAGIYVVTKLPGTRLGDPEDGHVTAADATSEQVQELIATIQGLHDAGLEIEPTIGNILYDKNNGFSLVDYQLAKGTLNTQSTLRIILDELHFDNLDTLAAKLEAVL